MATKILIIGPAWVGDMVMAQCLFKLLKQHQPEAIIDVLAPAWSLPLLARMPEVSSAIVMPIGHGVLGLAQRYQIGKSLRGRGYTQAIILPNSFKSALIPFFAKIPLRTGWHREMRGLILNDARRLNKKKYPLMIERFMALGLKKDENLSEPYPIPALVVSETSCEAALKKHHLQKTTQPILALCPGAEFGPAKRWPEAYYAQIANAKLAQGWQVWLFGSAKDRVGTDNIMALTQNRCVNLAGQTTLEEAIDLLSLTTLVVSNDSGLMHIAAALNKPLVVVYGPTSAGFTPPLHAQAKTLSLALDCQPCFQRECPLQHNRCMQDLKPEKVLDVMRQLCAF